MFRPNPAQSSCCKELTKALERLSDQTGRLEISFLDLEAKIVLCYQLKDMYSQEFQAAQAANDIAASITAKIELEKMNDSLHTLRDGYVASVLHDLGVVFVSNALFVSLLNIGKSVLEEEKKIADNTQDARPDLAKHMTLRFVQSLVKAEYLRPVERYILDHGVLLRELSIKFPLDYFKFRTPFKPTSKPDFCKKYNRIRPATKGEEIYNKR